MSDVEKNLPEAPGEGPAAEVPVPEGDLADSPGKSISEEDFERYGGDVSAEDMKFSVFDMDRPGNDKESVRKEEFRGAAQIRRLPDNKLSWEGLPYEGPVQLFKSSDPPEKLPRVFHEFHTARLDMSDEADREQYSRLLQQLSENQVKVYKELVREDDKNSWTILITWAELYTALPEYRRPPQ